MKKFFALLCVSLKVFAFDPTIPVLDLQDYYNEETKEAFLNELKYACSEVGFFALVGTGVDQDILDNAYRQVEQFFHQDSSIKNKYLIPHLSGQRGFVPGESAKGETRVDFKEFYHIGQELSSEQHQTQGLIPNVWPEENSQFQIAMVNLFKALEKYTVPLGSALSELLGQEKEYLYEMTKESDTLMRAIYYPANPPPNAIWGAAHTDINLYTILPRSTAQGLQVKNKEGKWIDVIIPDNAFVINVGDMLENLSNGLFRSATHQIVDPGFGQERFSIVFFVHPRTTDDMSPLAHCIEETGGVRRFPNALHRELLSERLIELGLASHDMMKAFVDSGAIDRFKEVNRASEEALQKLSAAGLIGLED